MRNLTSSCKSISLYMYACVSHMYVFQMSMYNILYMRMNRFTEYLCTCLSIVHESVSLVRESVTIVKS